MHTAVDFWFRHPHHYSGSRVVDYLERVGALEGGARGKQAVVHRSSYREHPRYSGNSLYFCFQQEVGGANRRQSNKISGRGSGLNRALFKIATLG